MPSPQESIKILQKDLAVEQARLTGLERASQDARRGHQKALEDFTNAQKIVMASQSGVDETRNAYIDATEQYDKQLGRVNRLKGQLQSVGGQINHGIVDSEALRKAEEAQRALEIKMQVPA